MSFAHKLQAAASISSPFVRPTGSNYQRIEDLYQAGENNTNTDVNIVMQRRDTTKILTFPIGVFEFSDFTYLPGGMSYHYGLNIGLGIIGCGPGTFGNTDGTIFRMKTLTSTRASEVPTQTAGGTNQLYLAYATAINGVNPVISQIRLSGTEQGHLYGGLIIFQTTAAQMTDCLFTGIPGAFDSPPGETFAVNNGQNAGSIYTRVEVSGFREPDGNAADGTAVSASPFGHNSASNCTMTDCYFHDCPFSTFTFWQTHDCITYNTRSLRNGSPGTGKTAHGINHERAANITHINPIVNTQHDLNGNTGYHMSWNSDQSGYNGYLRVVHPAYDSQSRSPGNFIVWSNPTYMGVQNIYGKTYNNQVSVWASSTDNGATGTSFATWTYIGG